MEILQETSVTQKTFFSHVFSMSEESTAEVMNVLQYALMGIIPIIILNKIIIIHRIITYIPTYSGFKYENLTLTNVILAFLIIVLSIQTKLGLKVNIIVDRVLELWNGPTYATKEGMKQGVKVSKPVSNHAPSQADYLDNANVQQGTFPPAPVATTRQTGPTESYDNMIHGGMNRTNEMVNPGPMAANGLLGGSFGSSF